MVFIPVLIADFLTIHCIFLKQQHGQSGLAQAKTEFELDSQ
jgi:hypothetical protein